MGKGDPGRPLLFVAIPFGRKQDATSDLTVDFDALYEEVILPAGETAGLATIRADEETLGGFIHRPMYERLLLAEIVVADLTFANPNVFYELGVRHAARPWATVLICAKNQKRPVDVAPLRTLLYELADDGALVDADKLKTVLTDHLRAALDAQAPDSPLFQLLDDYPGVVISPDTTESFRERALWSSNLATRAHEAGGSDRPEEAAAVLARIEEEARTLPSGQEQVFVSLILAHRSLEAWDAMVRLAESLPPGFASLPKMREQLALALNRRNRSGDRWRAIEILEGLIDEQGASPETLGILGRCHKDRWREKVRHGDPGARDALDAAIDTYGQGFEADPRDFYPGVNLLTLLAARGEAPDLDQIEELVPVVGFAVGRHGGLGSRNYWVLASVLEVAALRGHEDEGLRALSSMTELGPERWMAETTAENLTALSGALQQLGCPVEWVETAIASLSAKR